MERAENKKETKIVLRPYRMEDRGALADFFAALIDGHREYISHGELQMGIAVEPGVLAPDFREVWLRYLDRQVARSDNRLLLAEAEGRRLAGFVLFGTETDGGEPYGVIYDLGVDPEFRGRRIGMALVEEVVAALRRLGVGACYLESGIGNRSAHEFFERFGFRPVSQIFRLPLE